MNILITGGLGHIGSSLLETGLNGNKITVIDNFATQRYASLRHLGESKFVEEDIAKLSKDFLAKFDVAIHLAAITDAASSFVNKNKIEEVNVEATKTFIDRLPQDALVIFPSSTSVYGSAEEIMTENSIPNPQSPYAESKLKIEEYLKTRKNSIVLRLGTIFGTSAGMRFHTAINKFCYQFRLGQQLTVWRENLQMKRPYLGLGDLHKIIMMTLNGKLPENDLYNVVSENTELSQIIREFKRYGEPIVEYVDTPLLNQYSYTVSRAKIESFGFLPTSRITEGIYQTLNWLGYFDESMHNRS